MLNPGNIGIIEAVSAHVARHIAPVDRVFHELVSSDIHVDVHHVRPSLARPFHTLVTSGMSERPMQAGPDVREFRFAELVLLLDPEWPLEEARFSDENVYWPIGLLKSLARFPFDANTWIGARHTIAGGDPPEPLAPATELAAALLLPMGNFGAEFLRMPRPDGATTYFWGVMPIYAEELELKMKKGSDALVDALDAVGTDFIVRQSRPRAVPRRLIIGYP